MPTCGAHCDSLSAVRLLLSPAATSSTPPSTRAAALPHRPQRLPLRRPAVALSAAHRDARTPPSALLGRSLAVTHIAARPPPRAPLGHGAPFDGRSLWRQPHQVRPPRVRLAVCILDLMYSIHGSSPNMLLRPGLCSPSPVLGAWRRGRWSETLPGRCIEEGRWTAAVHHRRGRCLTASPFQDQRF